MQVIECEEEKEVLAKRVSEVCALNGELHCQLTSLRHELLVTSTELRVHATRNQNQTQEELRATTAGTATTNEAETTAGAITTPAAAAPSSSALMLLKSNLEATEAYAKDLHRQ